MIDRSEIGALANQHKIGLTQMDLNATIQMSIRYPNTKLVLVLTKDERNHRRWINEKFHIFTWIKDSVEDLLAFKVGRNVHFDSSETSESKIDFIGQLVNEVRSILNLLISN